MEDLRWYKVGKDRGGRGGESRNKKNIHIIVYCCVTLYWKKKIREKVQYVRFENERITKQERLEETTKRRWDCDGREIRGERQENKWRVRQGGREDSYCHPTCLWQQDFRHWRFCFLPFMWSAAPRIRGSVRISLHTSCTAQSRPVLLCRSQDNLHAPRAKHDTRRFVSRLTPLSIRHRIKTVQC